MTTLPNVFWHSCGCEWPTGMANTCTSHRLMQRASDMGYKCSLAPSHSCYIMHMQKPLIVHNKTRIPSVLSHLRGTVTIRWLDSDAVWSPLFTAGSTVTTQLINCVVTVLPVSCQGWLHCPCPVTVKSPCHIGDGWNRSFAVFLCTNLSAIWNWMYNECQKSSIIWK